MPVIQFTVDSALLRELGERLVGKPHIALAELIKNSYDADATEVVVSFEGGHLEVVDNGHGMTLPEFRDYWMRIGSIHKERQRVSRKLSRRLTGSKGIGRLSAQFLGSQLRIRTASAGEQLTARVDWTRAVQAGELTKASASYETGPVVGDYIGSKTGTALDIWDLNQIWGPKQFESLAREIWQLQPPFRDDRAARGDFRIQLKSSEAEVVERFARQMQAFLAVWHARLVGRLVESDNKTPGKRNMVLALEFDDGSRMTTAYDCEECHLSQLEFEIRVFSLHNRQPAGIRVDDLRGYLKEFGGVHVYDSGFHLPYYGVNTDWLRIELDHSHRLSRSELLPERLQVEEGLNFLPTNSRIFGVVRVDTAAERESDTAPGRGIDHLMIQASRDRLVDNAAFQDLRDMVRWAVDYYATREALRSLKEAENKAGSEPVRPRLTRVEDVLDRHRDSIPAPVFRAVKSEVRGALDIADVQEEYAASQVSLLAPLATAGIAAVAYEHEVAKQLQQLEQISADLEQRAASSGQDAGLMEIAEALNRWVVRARALRELFAPVMDEDSRRRVQRYKVRAVIDDVAHQLGPLNRGVMIATSAIDPGMRLPAGTYAEWTALFQNVFINAFNAMLDTRARQLRAKTDIEGRRHAVVIEDTGVGVDLATAERLFEPFERRLKLSDDRKRLGLGGTGLGLSIVRMIATSRGAQVGFVPPSDDFRTAFRLSWSSDA